MWEWECVTGRAVRVCRAVHPAQMFVIRCEGRLYIQKYTQRRLTLEFVHLEALLDVFADTNIGRKTNFLLFSLHWVTILHILHVLNQTPFKQVNHPSSNRRQRMNWLNPNYFGMKVVSMTESAVKTGIFTRRFWGSASCWDHFRSCFGFHEFMFLSLKSLEELRSIANK